MFSGLVIGGDGLIGRALGAHLAEAGWRVTSTSRRENRSEAERLLDLRDPEASRADWSDQLHVPGLVIFLSAAATGFAHCNDDPAGTRLINVDNTIRLACEFMKQGAHVIYLSSNAVFDGKTAYAPEESPLSPETEYGCQKAACEIGLQEAANDAGSGLAIVRLTKVVDRSQPLVGGWIKDLREGATVRAAVDLVLSPITLGYVVDGLRKLAERRLVGRYHLSGSDDVTYFDLASSLLAACGSRGRVEADRVRDRLGSVPSPDYSSVGMRRTSERLGLRPQPLDVVARDLLA